MKRLIDIVKMLQGLVITSLIPYLVLGASALDSKDTILVSDWVIYIYTLGKMGLLIWLFQIARNELILHYRKKETKEEREQQRREELIYGSIQISGRSGEH